jgi:hypothetical protein
VTHCCDKHGFEAADPMPFEGKKVSTVVIEPA